MKRSDKLLTGLLVAGVFTLVSYTIALKAEHDKIYFGDPFWGFSSKAIKPFRVLKLQGLSKKNTLTDSFKSSVTSQGYSSTVIGVQAGKRFELRMQQASAIPFTYRYAGDTLIMQYEPEFFARRIGPGEAILDMPFAYINSPFAYITAPSLQAIIVEEATCKVAEFSSEKVLIEATNGHVYLNQCTIGELTAVVQRGSLLQTSPANRIRSATIISLDKSSFTAEQDVFGALQQKGDSTARLTLPASLLTKIVLTNGYVR